MPLSHTKKGQTVVLKEISWGKELKRKLNNLGLTDGVKLEIVKHSKLGPWIIEVRGARLALGRGIIDKIEVELA
ncbi:MULTISPECIES: FeoA family protein [unclassified Fusibacter]|uniref:FeoA family protein n=1 Tax=unclassified Fusibacter TaxID=2624464 RepID=UPI001011DE0A|nr:MULTISPECIES: FeoA family protein [unclassified Fusibacter]MCK8059798.1 ferrous iron transport protein A [Fusibacter sp. A2]NPE21599.1 ferrous iron transport protein A [Fusibacter sp. A1]RXV62006.1 ferrous iron transport protein A [Fusibacter sp. A1]